MSIIAALLTSSGRPTVAGSAHRRAAARIGLAVMGLLVSAAVGPGAQGQEPARVIRFGTVERQTRPGALVTRLDDAAYDQDLSEIVAKAAGLSHRIVEFKTAPEVLAAFEHGEIDVIPSYARLPERLDKYLFSVRHTVSTAAVFVHDGRRAPESLADVAALRLVAVRESSASSYVQRKGWSGRTLLVDTTEEAMRAVADARVDACISNQLVGLSVLRQLKLEDDVAPVFTLPDSAVDFCMVVRRTDGELLTRLNDGLLIASERGDLQRHREKWLPAFESYWLSRRSVRQWLGWAGAGLVLLAVLSWLWYRARLRTERRMTAKVTSLVEVRTHELETANAGLRASEEAVRRLNAELEARVFQRTAELGERVTEVERLNAELESFAYSVSHDLRAPLRNIAGFVELLSQRTGDRLDREEKRFIATVTAESRRLGKLIDELLAFSRLGRAELKREPVALDELVAEARAELRAEIGERPIVWRIAPLPIVRGDRTLLRQVVANLLGNAVKFTRQRSPAIIEVGTAASAPADGTATIFVRDNGAGFNPKYADKLFGVFQRLHNQRDFEGTGIGLANVKRIVERHGGTVRGEGKVDNGAVFYLKLKVYPYDDLATAQDSPRG